MGLLSSHVCHYNQYGKYDNFSLYNSHLIPAIIRKIDLAIETNSDVEIWGDGNARREFMYADDLANAIFFVIEYYNQIMPIINIGLGYDYSINEYYQTIANIMQYNGQFKHDINKPVGMKQKLLSINLQNKLGWEPKYSLEEGINKTIEYYKDNIK